MHTQVGFDLNYVKHYGSPEMAQQMVGKTLASYIEQGVVFNIQIVEQRRGGMKPNAEDRRFIPLVYAIRVDEKKLPYSAEQCAINFARLGFVAF
jgi:hypothetical protein